MVFFLLFKRLLSDPCRFVHTVTGHLSAASLWGSNCARCNNVAVFARGIIMIALGTLG